MVVWFGAVACGYLGGAPHPFQDAYIPRSVLTAAAPAGPSRTRHDDAFGHVQLANALLRAAKVVCDGWRTLASAARHVAMMLIVRRLIVRGVIWLENSLVGPVDKRRRAEPNQGWFLSSPPSSRPPGEGTTKTSTSK